MYSIFIQTSTPCIVDKTTPLYLLGEPASLLVVTYPHPLLSLVFQQLPHPLAFTPLILSHLACPNYIVYVENINNLDRLHLGQLLLTPKEGETRTIGYSKR
jgi:hypothetical protein